MRGWPEDSDDQLKWIQQNWQPVLPPAGFDPLTADRAQLEKAGLPPKPDPTTQQELYDFWVSLFSEPLTFEQDARAFEFDHALPRNFGSGGTAVARSGRESSPNWSGGYITPRNGLMFTHIVGSFRAPAVMVPTGMPASAEYACSTWIGLDGQREYLNSTLPQIGTGQYLNVGGVPGTQYLAWIQWWPLAPVTFPTFLVGPGHQIKCWLSLLNLTHALGIIANKSTGGIRLFIMKAPMVTKPPVFTAPIQAKVSGATAEWVTERPTSLVTQQPYELPDFGQVVFDDCYALAAQAPSPVGRVERLVGPTLIRMYRIASNPHRSVTISVAERLAYDSIKTRYKT